MTQTDEMREGAAPAHFLSIQAIRAHQIQAFIKKAHKFAKDPEEITACAHPSGSVIAHLFFEPSTRTRCSFEIAAHKLGLYPLNVDIAHCSLQKGETLADSLRNLVAIGANAFVIRHNKARWIDTLVPQITVPVINAGDGDNEHPTQAMQDVCTIAHHKPDFSRLIVTIIGDIRHSRVVRSLTVALKKLGVPQIRFVAPEPFLPDPIGVYEKGIRFYQCTKTAVKNADVIVTLRIQSERFDTTVPHNIRAHYVKDYKLTAKILRLAKPDAIVMHPGPVNRGVEIESEVADGRQSVILAQVKWGVFMRMAILTALLAART